MHQCRVLFIYRLNEGFATYLSYIGMKRAEPEWDTESVWLVFRNCEFLTPYLTFLFSFQMFLTGDLHGVLDLGRHLLLPFLICSANDSDCNADATVSSRAIVMDVDTPDQINAVFDTISYSKGSSVIRLVLSWSNR